MSNRLNNLETGISRQQLLERSKSISKSAKGDLSLLEKRGVTAELIESLDEKIQKYEQTSYHSAVMLTQKYFTEARNLKLDEFVEENNILRSQLSLFNGIDSNIEYPVLKRSMSHKSVEDLINIGEETLQLLESQSDKVSVYGVNQDIIDAYASLLSELKEAQDKQFHTCVVADNETSIRQAVKSELYRITLYVSKIGRAYWLRKDKRRYNDYVLHKKGLPPKSDTTTSLTEPATTTSLL